MPPQQPSGKNISQNPAVMTFLINRCALFNKIWSREQLGFFFCYTVIIVSCLCLLLFSR